MRLLACVRRASHDLRTRIVVLVVLGVFEGACDHVYGTRNVRARVILSEAGTLLVRFVFMCLQYFVFRGGAGHRLCAGGWRRKVAIVVGDAWDGRVVPVLAALARVPTVPCGYAYLYCGAGT